MLDFAGANAESQRPECTMRGRVAIAANEGLSRLGNAKLRADDVHDALILAVHVEEANAGFTAVLFQGVELELGIVIENGQRAVRGGYGVVHHGEGEIRAANLASFGAEAGKGLGRRTFVDEVTVNVNNRGLAGIFANNVGIPDFLI